LQFNISYQWFFGNEVIVLLVLRASKEVVTSCTLSRELSCEFHKLNDFFIDFELTLENTKFEKIKRQV
jgi:hypothetical protein